MRNTFFLLIISGLILFCNSCENSKIDSTISFDEHYFDVSAQLSPIEDADGTKAYASSYSSPSWSVGDKISIINLTTAKVLGGQLSTTTSGNIAHFSGSVIGNISTGDKLAFLYPAMDNLTEVDFTSQNYDISTQDGSTEVKLIAYSLTTASSNSTEFTSFQLSFTYFMSYLKLNMANLPGSSSISKYVVKNVPDVMVLKINGSKSDFAPEYQKVNGGITITGGSYSTKDVGTTTARLAIFPDASVDSRSIIAVIDGMEYRGVFTNVALSGNKYYNTIVSNFVKTLKTSISQYGIYSVDGNALFQYNDNRDQIVLGIDGTKLDFSMMNLDSKAFWSVTNIPDNVKEDDEITISYTGHGIENLEYNDSAESLVVKSEPDGNYTKLFIKSDDFIFVIKK